MVGVAPARETAQGADRDMEAAFPPGAVVRTPEALRSALDGIFGLEPDSAYQFKRRLFHDHFDGMNALRVAERIRDLTEVYGGGGSGSASAWRESDVDGRPRAATTPQFRQIFSR